MNILIVDDSMICRNIMKKLFKNNDFVDLIFIANNGLEAIKQITLNKDEINFVLIDNEMPVLNGTHTVRHLRDIHYDEINFVLIDNEMPVLNGTHTVRHLRDIHYDKIIFGITSSTGDLIQDFENSGIDYLFSKPFDENKLNMLIDFISKYGFYRMKNKKIMMNDKGRLNWGYS